MHSLSLVIIYLLIHFVICDVNIEWKEERTKIWLSQCKTVSSCCTVWNDLVHKADEMDDSFLNTILPRYHVNISAYDPYEPSWNCELQQRTPMKAGDGPKWTCGIDLLTSSSLVYSFGSHGDTSFEEGIQKSTNTKEIYIFDPTLKNKDVIKVKNKGFQLIESGLVGKGKKGFIYHSKKYAANDLLNHMINLNHVDYSIDILKVDIEGSEYDAFKNIKIGECKDSDVVVKQILIEVHHVNKILIKNLMESFSSCNFRLFHKERNHWGCLGYKCIEFSLISPSFAYQVFEKTHPSCLAIK